MKATKSAALVTMSESEEDEAEVVDEVIEEVAEEETPEVVPDPVVEESKHMKDSEKEDEESMDDEEEDKKEMKKKEKKSEVTLADVLEKLNRLVPDEAPEVEVHPLDEAVAGLKKDFSDVLAMELSPEEKLKLIQDSYAEVGKSIVNIVKAEVVDTNQPEQTNVADNSQLTQLANIVEGLAQKVDMLTVKLDKGQALQGPKVPEQRSFRPEAYNPFQAQTVVPGKLPSLHTIVNRSVGLPDDA